MTQSRLKYLLLFQFIFIGYAGYAQYSQFEKKDSVAAKYPYKFPLLGSKAFEKGFNIPYSAGGMLNYFTAKQDVVIPEIAIGFNNSEMLDLTELLEFGTVNAHATSVNVRPDLWVLPFFNVYGIFGKAWAQTEVELTYPVTLKAVANLEGTSLGFGVTGAGGLGKYFFVVDGNWIWTMMSNFEAPVRSYTFSGRLGRAFRVGKNPESNIAPWIGGMRIKMGGVTEGSILMGDLIPQETWQRRDEIVNNYWNWYDNEATLPQKLIADKVLTPIVDRLEAADGSGSIKYRIRKEPKQKWNMIIGGQYQLNKHHQFRAEGGIIGNRKSLLLSYNYRFGF
ncbi:hypothetical protein SLH46_01855 [Draconibacterium sp. IB214405]|uniref:hypothetical protein n=1 Tax=Draconibacterium sp. IB214405 TaxID=3097352 RepID=UPI002A1148DB|nr:hypothetical protein [Draconibacterium sp. IB214405]MDX8337907.1 hypothetical protein [Draconibacterium sp. IB214405]